MHTIGVTSVGSGVAQAVLDSLRAVGERFRVVGFDASPWAKGAYECDEVRLVPLAAGPEYKSAMLELCRESGIELLIPGSDPELVPLAELEPLLAARGTRVVVGRPESVRVCRDKLALHDLMVKRGVPFAPTFTPMQAYSLLADSDFPVVLKPRSGSASVGVRLLFSRDELAQYLENGYWVIQQYLMPIAAGRGTKEYDDCLRTLRRLGKPPQKDELSIQVFVSGGGEIIGRFASLNRLKDGVPVQVEPLEDPQVWRAAAAVASALIELGLRGPCNFQGRFTRDGIVFFEANPRFTGITNMRALMGYREVEAAIRHFQMHWDADSTSSLLPFRTDKVGVRQVTDAAIPRTDFEQLRDHGRFSRIDAKPKALITGAAGYLGFELAEALLGRGVVSRVVAPVRDLRNASESWSTSPFADQVELFEWDLAEPGIDLDGVSLVIHAAAVRPEAGCEAAAYMENETSTLNLVNAVRRAHTPRLIYISSQAVYGTSRPPEFGEDLLPDPSTSYGWSKLAGEMLVRTLDGRDTAWMILRLSRIYGIGRLMRWDELPHKFARRTAEGGALEVRGSGRQKMDLIHISDAAELVIKALGSPMQAWCSVYNGGGGEPISVGKLAAVCTELASETGLEAPPIINVNGSGIHPSFGLDISRAGERLGWRPRMTVREAMAVLVERCAGSLLSTCK